MFRLTASSAEEVTQLRELYHTTKDVRVRTRSQMILLAFEGLSAPRIAKIVDFNPESVRRCMLCYRNEGIQGLYDKPRSGRPRRVTPDYLQRAVDLLRQRPRSFDLSFSVWTLQRLVDYLTDQTGITVSDETLRSHLHAQGISFSQPQHKISSPDPHYTQKKRRLRQRETT